MTIRRIARVRGRVQGVGFRYAAAAQAESLGVVGTVRNLFDGTVEADIEGPEPAVSDMIEWLRSGPPSARVDGVTLRDEQPQDATGFRVVG